MGRRIFITLLSAGAAVRWPRRACTQQPTITVIGGFSGAGFDMSADPYADAGRPPCRDDGAAEGGLAPC